MAADASHRHHAGRARYRHRPHLVAPVRSRRLHGALCGVRGRHDARAGGGSRTAVRLCGRARVPGASWSCWRPPLPSSRRGSSAHRSPSPAATRGSRRRRLALQSPPRGPASRACARTHATAGPQPAARDSRFSRGFCRVRRRPRHANRRVVRPRRAAIRGLRPGGGSRAIRLELSHAEAERAGRVAHRVLRCLRGRWRSASRTSPSVAAGGDASRGVRALRRSRDNRTWCRPRALRPGRSVVPPDPRRQDDALGGDRRVLCVPALADARAAAARPPGRHRFRQPAEAGRGPEAARVSARRRQHAARLRVRHTTRP